MVNERALAALLAEFARTLLTDYAVQEILDQVVGQVVEILPVTGAGITLIGTEQSPEYVAASDATALTFERLQTELQQGPCLAAHVADAPVIVPDLKLDTAFPSFSRASHAEGMAAAFSFPLRHRDTRLGALDLYRDTPGGLDEHERETAQTLADVVAAYLVNAQWRERARHDVDWFRHKALHDPLTGLANRLLLQERLTHAAQRVPRAHTGSAVLFADLDHFKLVNDRYGHEAGDLLLIAVAERLSALVRPGDTLARISGDEFVLLCEELHATDEVDAIARRVRDAFLRPFDIDGHELTVTASIGVACTAPGEPLTDELLSLADQAMYRHKAEGSGPRVIVLDQPDTAGAQR